MPVDVGGILVSVLQVLAAGLLLGAGLPALFALGMRLFSAAEDASGSAAGSAGALRTAGWACFGLCLVAALFGIVVIVFGDLLFG